MTDWKKQRLENLLERLERGDEVSLRDLKNALTSDEYEDYKQMLEQQKQVKNFASHGSAEYDKWLKKGLFHYHKADSGRFNKLDSRKFFNKAEACFERAIEQLQQDIYQDGTVQLAYDRVLDFSANGSISLDPIGMPRRLSSRSLDNIGHVSNGVRVKKKKRDFKMDIIKLSLANFHKRDEHEMKKGSKGVVQRGAADEQKMADLLKGLRAKIRGNGK
jgi:tetratricopeptide (TPR) repeat protein